jgi:hypothetical protein
VNGSQRLKTAVKRLRRPAATPAPPMKPDPHNAFEVAVAEQIRAIQEDLGQLRSQLNWLLIFIVGAALTNVVITILK